MSRDAPPPLPGGYRVGEKVFYTGASDTLDNGDKVVHGGQGEVVGPGDGEERDTHVAVLFPGITGNQGSVDCYLREVRRLRCHPPR